jgi:hypothetical protein
MHLTKSEGMGRMGPYPRPPRLDNPGTLHHGMRRESKKEGLLRRSGLE